MKITFTFLYIHIKKRVVVQTTGWSKEKVKNFFLDLFKKKIIGKNLQ